jgi:hypothetical protein
MVRCFRQHMHLTGIWGQLAGNEQLLQIVLAGQNNYLRTKLTHCIKAIQFSGTVIRCYF